MRRAVWMHPVDLERHDPDALAGDLVDRGCDAVRLALAYHGGRFVMAGDGGPRVVDLGTGGVFLPIDVHAPRGLERRIHATSSALVLRFLGAARRRGLQVWGWTVLCHDDETGQEGRTGACVVNLDGGALPYALCPARPAVRDYLASLCGALGHVEGLAGLDLEALGWLGLQHQSAHDKHAGPIGPAAAWLLSICLCEACTGRLGREAADEFRRAARGHLAATVRAWPGGLQEPGLGDVLEAALGAPLLAHVVSARRAAVIDALSAIRAATPIPLDLRIAPSPLFLGGKAPVSLGEAAGYVEAVTYSWLGEPLDVVVRGIEALPARADRPCAIQAGFSAIPPTCHGPADAARCTAAARARDLDGVAAYCEPLATRASRAWLAQAFLSAPSGVSA